MLLFLGVHENLRATSKLAPVGIGDVVKLTCCPVGSWVDTLNSTVESMMTTCGPGTFNNGANVDSNVTV